MTRVRVGHRHSHGCGRRRHGWAQLGLGIVGTSIVVDGGAGVLLFSY